MAAAFSGSPEYRTPLVDDLFQPFLGRGAGPAGRAAFAGAVAQDGHDDRFVMAVVGSDYYLARLPSVVHLGERVRALSPARVSASPADEGPTGRSGPRRLPS